MLCGRMLHNAALPCGKCQKWCRCHHGAASAYCDMLQNAAWHGNAIGQVRSLQRFAMPIFTVNGSVDIIFGSAHECKEFQSHGFCKLKYSWKKIIFLMWMRSILRHMLSNFHRVAKTHCVVFCCVA